MASRTLLLFLTAALLAACSGGSVDPEPEPTSDPEDLTPRREAFAPGELASLDVPRAEADVAAADITSVVAADRALGLDLLRVTAGNENLMLSPYSIATALSMVHAGAEGTTADEMARVMHLDVDEEILHSVRNALDRALVASTWEAPEEDTREPFVIRPVNSAWGQGGYPFLDEYLGTLARHYGAGLRLVDYIHEPDAARSLINDWTAEATEGRIEDLIPPDAIDDMTRMVLVNAIWFHANWVKQFDPQQTADGSFTFNDGTEVTVPMMSAAGLRTGYFENSKFRAVRLAYTGDAAMVVVLPKEGSPTDLAAVLSPADMELAWEDRLVDLTVPRFEFESRLPLNDALERLGMVEAFIPPSGAGGADFTRMTPERELFLSAALHQSFVAVDEFGTEAAAATAMVMENTSAPMPAEFRADRPFLFWIEHTPTGEPLFLGQVTDPRG